MGEPYYQRLDLNKVEHNVPKELRELPVWLLWKEKQNDERGKPSKVPFYADGSVRKGELDTPQDREKLVLFAQAADVYRPDEHAGMGVALGLTDSGVILSGIDLDASVGDGRMISSEAQQVIDASSGAYTEISPSAKGLKIFGTGNIGTARQADLEIYSGSRFFTITGEIVSGDSLRELQAAAELARELFAEHGEEEFTREGSRNMRLFSLAILLRRSRTPLEEAEVRIFRHNENSCDPPLTDREVRRIIKSAWRYDEGFKHTDLGNAERLIARYGEDFRYIDGAGFAIFDNHRWDLDQAEPRVHNLMENVVREIYREAADLPTGLRTALVKHATISESKKRLDAAVGLAQRQPTILDKLDRYDEDPDLVGLRNGVYDLARDEFREGRREDRITKQVNVIFDPAATCPRWEQFQLEIHNGDAAMVAYKQRAWGYTLSGHTSEQKLFMAFGEGANGKSTELNVAQRLMGGYACKIQPETLLARDQRSQTNDIARMRGARLVATVEIEDGKHFAESVIKQLTGEDKITARFLFKEHFEYRFTGKIWVATNNRPDIKETNHAIWRRIDLIPYLVRFAGDKRIPNLERLLAEELPGILNWMLEGHRQWKKLGLAQPAAVDQATTDYRNDMDRIGNFLRECCTFGPEVRGRTLASQVYKSYSGWTKAQGQHPVAARKFHEAMARDHNLRRVTGSAGLNSDYPNLLLVTLDYVHDIH